MAAPVGNRFWEMRSSHGRNPIFPSPDALWAACCEYFEWVEDSPLLEEKIFSASEGLRRAEIAKMRAMTLDGLCLFLDIDDQTWANYRAREDFFGVVSRAEKVMRSQKFAGAAADLLNPNIIARDLGLRDKSETAVTGPDGKELRVVMTDEQLLAIAAQAKA